MSHPGGSPGADLARLYRETRERLSGLVLGLRDGELATPVPACPGWSVSDVVYHLFGIVEDVVAGRLTRPPTEAETADQVARHRGTPIPVVVESWKALASSFEEMVAAVEVWPAVIDVATHEQDIRGALGRAGARDSDVIRAGADWLVAVMQPAVPMRVLCEGEDAAHEADGDPGAVLTLRTTRFETFRFRMGRRSRSQVLGLDWSGDPSSVIDQLFVFGPSPTDIVE